MQSAKVSVGTEALLLGLLLAYLVPTYEIAWPSRSGTPEQPRVSAQQLPNHGRPRLLIAQRSYGVPMLPLSIRPFRNLFRRISRALRYASPTPLVLGQDIGPLVSGGPWWWPGHQTKARQSNLPCSAKAGERLQAPSCDSPAGQLAESAELIIPHRSSMPNSRRCSGGPAQRGSQRHQQPDSRSRDECPRCKCRARVFSVRRRAAGGP